MSGPVLLRRSLWFIAVALAFALISSGCSKDDDAADSAVSGRESAVDQPADEPEPAEEANGESESGGEPADEPEPAAGPADEDAGEPVDEPTDEPADDTLADVDELTQWALDYSGGSGGVAVGDPIRIGFANSNDFFPDVESGAKAAVEYLNNTLGGVDGQPLEIVVCNMAVPDDGASCGAEFANDDDLVVASAGTVLVGNADYWSAISGIKPSLLATPGDISDYTAKDTVSYVNGALGAGMGLGLFVALDLQPQTAALVVTDDNAGRGGASVFVPIIENAGIEMNQVFVPPTATAPEIAAALLATGAEAADVVIIALFEQGCIAAYDALTSLGIDPLVVTTSVCWGEGVQTHLADVGDPSLVPNGWYFSSDGYNLFTGDFDSGVDTYLSVMDDMGLDDISRTIGVPQAFAAIMSIARHLNTVEGDFSFEAVDAEIRGFKGPAMMQAGPIDCGQSLVFSGICAGRVSIHQYLDGEWLATREGDDAVDISTGLFVN